MVRKRKRQGRSEPTEAPVSVSVKRQKKHHPAASTTGSHGHPVLCRYYPKVQTLREYVLAKLPSSSKSRRRKLTLSRHNPKDDDGELKSAVDEDQDESDGSKLNNLLDSTLIGIREVTGSESICRSKDFEIFSQQISSTVASSLGEGTLSQSEVSASFFSLSFNICSMDFAC